MPEKKSLERARADMRAGKSASTQAGEFVREEIHHVRAGKHGARSAKQAIAIGLSKARRAGVKIPARAGAAAPRGRSAIKAPHPSRTRSRASERALAREGHGAGSHRALSRHARATAPQAARTRKRNAARASHRTTR
jgi:hypothetical protein